MVYWPYLYLRNSCLLSSFSGISSSNCSKENNVFEFITVLGNFSFQFKGKLVTSMWKFSQLLRKDLQAHGRLAAQLTFPDQRRTKKRRRNTSETLFYYSSIFYKHFYIICPKCKDVLKDFSNMPKCKDFKMFFYRI